MTRLILLEAPFFRLDLQSSYTQQQGYLIFSHDSRPLSVASSFSWAPFGAYLNSLSRSPLNGSWFEQVLCSGFATMPITMPRTNQRTRNAESKATHGHPEARAQISSVEIFEFFRKSSSTSATAESVNIAVSQKNCHGNSIAISAFITPGYTGTASLLILASGRLGGCYLAYRFGER